MDHAVRRGVVLLAGVMLLAPQWCLGFVHHRHHPLPRSHLASSTAAPLEAPTAAETTTATTTGEDALAAAAAAATGGAFAPCSEPLEPEKVTMYSQWFTNFGMTPPDPPKNAKGSGFGGKAKKGGPIKKAAAPAQKLYCHRPPEGMVTVLRASSSSSSSSSSGSSSSNNDEDDAAAAEASSEEELSALGAAARCAIYAALPESGAVLLRGLPMRSAEAFSHFWRGCLAAENPAPLEEGRYVSLGGRAGRDKLNGVDLATNVPPQFPLLCHNEVCYNPTTVGRIALYCVQDAPLGGETLVTRNRDLQVPPKARQFLEGHGGLLYSRDFYDARRGPPAEEAPPAAASAASGKGKQGGKSKKGKKQQAATQKAVATKPPSALLGSWQEKCGLPEDAGRPEAEAFFAGMGFDVGSQLEWSDEDGGVLRVTNQHPGFVTDVRSIRRKEGGRVRQFSQSAGQPVSQSVSHSVSQPASQSASQLL